MNEPQRCPSCRTGASFEKRGAFSEGEAHRTLEGDGRVEQWARWERYRCQQCEQEFALLDKRIRVEYDAEGNEVKDSRELIA